MLLAQRHRGPDGAGMASWSQANGWESRFAPSVEDLPDEGRAGEGPTQCVLGHNWLAIQDVGAPARQPMFDGDVGIVFNGEVYNFPELRAPLERDGCRFRSDSDTEVLLALWRERGPGCLGELRGMFAFAAFEPRTRALWLVRDPYGIKPLYYARMPEGFWFASEIRSLHAAGVVRRSIRESAAVASAAAAVNKFDATQTLYEGVFELPPGHWMRVDDREVMIRRYEDLPPADGDLHGDAATDALRGELERSVQVHLRASRRIATCLSGGLDSANLAWLIGRHKDLAGHDFAAFTICTSGREDSEVELARGLTAKAGLDHHVFDRCQAIRPEDVLEMVVAYEVPNHVIGPINQFLLLREVAASGATVVLDGQGGDELVSGYPWFAPVLFDAMRRRGQDPSALEELRRGRAPLKSPTLEAFDRMFHNADYWVRNQLSGRDFLGWSAEQVLSLPETHYYLSGGDWQSFRDREYFRGELQYLLRQEDRLGMWFGLECRVPFVDRELIGVASRLAPDWLLHEGYTKYPFRTLFPEMSEGIRWNTRKRGFWETDVAQFGWVDEFGRGLALESPLLRRLFPPLETGWASLDFNQRWRLTQLAVLERCTVRSDVGSLLGGASAGGIGAVS